MDRWICPNDRQLALRAKLGTGWSVFTNRSHNEQEGSISTEDIQHIVSVLKRKELCDKIEKDRIGHMVLHLQNIKRNKSQRHKRECHICGHNFIILYSPFSRKLCEFCGKTTCENCISQLSTDSDGSMNSKDLDGKKSTIINKLSTLFVVKNNGLKAKITICKYCFETREIWKRSGAWKIQQLPEFNLPTTNNICPHPDSCSKVILNSQSTNIDSASWETYRRPPKWTTIKDNLDEDNIVTEPAFERFSFNPFEEELNEQMSKNETSNHAYANILNNGSKNTGEEKQRSDHDNDIIFQNQSSPVGSSFRNQDEKQSFLNVLNNSPRNINEEKRRSFHDISAKFYHQNPPVGSLFWSQDSFLKDHKKTKEENLGILNYKLMHDSALCQLIITINNGKDLKSMDSNGLSDPYVKCHLLPGNSHKTKLRTKTCYRTLNPIWNEKLIYHGIRRVDMDNKTLRLAVLDEDTIGFDWIGEYRFYLPDLNSDEEYTFSHSLLHRQPIAKGNDDLVDHERGKILLALLYNDSNSTLHITIVRCTELAPMDCNGFSDPFCKIYLKPDKIRITKRKTQTKKMTLNPYFNEEFIIELDSDWIKEKTLEISVWDYDHGLKNDFIGVVKFHYRAKGDRGKFWRAVHDCPNKKFEGWFILCADLSETE